MPQELQNEAQPAQGPLDEGLPEICRQGDDRRLDNRVREAEKRPRPVRSRAGQDDCRGDEACCGDQAAQGACLLEEPDARKPREAPYTPEEKARGEGIRQARRAYAGRGSRARGDPREDQGFCEVAQRARPRRGPVDGDGHRLSAASWSWLATSYASLHSALWFSDVCNRDLQLYGGNVHATRYVSIMCNML